VVGYVAEPLIGAGLGRLLGTAGVSAGTGAAIGTALALAVAGAGAGRRRPVHRALTTMRRRRRHFALVTADGEPVGLLTLHDVLARLLPPR
jgi:hypothetical protein